jgi:hypothetical protein
VRERERESEIMRCCRHLLVKVGADDGPAVFLTNVAVFVFDAGVFTEVSER